MGDTYRSRFSGTRSEPTLSGVIENDLLICDGAFIFLAIETIYYLKKPTLSRIEPTLSRRKPTLSRIEPTLSSRKPTFGWRIMTCLLTHDTRLP